jgi:hypothetical protein
LTKLWGLYQEDPIFQAFDASVDIVGGVWVCEMMGRDPQRKRRRSWVWGALWILWTIIYLNLEK